MRKRHVGLLLGLAAVIGFSATVIAGIYSPSQSPLRPLGLSITDKVQLTGSDTTAISFNLLQAGYANYCKQMLPEAIPFTGAGLNQLDPQRLYFLFDYAPRVYFLNDGAATTNAVGATIATLSAPSNTVLTGNTFTIFPNTTCSLGKFRSGSGVRSTSEPLLYGDFVQLPTVKAGQQLAFFLMAHLDSQSVPDETYYNGTTNNADNFQHMIAFFPDNSQYIIVGFENQYGGGDKDCNDIIFVVDIGPMNALVLRNPNSLPK